MVQIQINKLIYYIKINKVIFLEIKLNLLLIMDIIVFMIIIKLWIIHQIKQLYLIQISLIMKWVYVNLFQHTLVTIVQVVMIEY